MSRDYLQTDKYILQFRAVPDIKEFDQYRELENNVTFAFLDPWAVYSGFVPAIIERLERNKYIVAGIAMIELNEARQEHMYRKNALSGQTTWHLARQVYCMGISVGLFLFKDTESGKPATAELIALKGNSNPRKNCQPGTIRSDFRSPNRSIKLMHSSDDWGDTLTEALVFFSRSELDNILRSCKKRAFRDLQVDKKMLSTSELSTESIKSQSFARLSVLLRKRIMRLVVSNSRAASEYKTFLGKWEEEFAGSMSVADELDKVYMFLKDELPYLRILASCGQQARRLSGDSIYKSAVDVNALIDILFLVNNIENYKMIDFDLVFQRFTLFYDRWEKLLFKTYLFHIHEMGEKTL